MPFFKPPMFSGADDHRYASQFASIYLRQDDKHQFLTTLVAISFATSKNLCGRGLAEEIGWDLCEPTGLITAGVKVVLARKRVWISFHELETNAAHSSSRIPLNLIVTEDANLEAVNSEFETHDIIVGRDFVADHFTLYESIDQLRLELVRSGKPCERLAI